MFRDSTVVGSWPVLVARLDAAGVVTRWAAAEPALREVGGAADLPRLLGAGVDCGQADELMGALVRLAAADGGDDADAVLVLLHLLSNGALTLASRLRDLGNDILALVVGELAAQIRVFPWRRRTRAYAASLLLDTKRALWRELRPGRPPSQRHLRDVVVDPLDAWQVLHLLDAPVVAAEAGTELRLVDVLAWARRRGVAPLDDLALLLELSRLGDQGAAATQEDLAERLRVNEKTLRRRRDRTLSALRAASGEYLRAVA